MLASRAKENNVYVVYANTVGGQDELVFDGYSMILDPKGKLLAAGKQFEEDLVTYDIKLPGPARLGADITSELILDEHRDFIDSIVISARSAGKERSLFRRRAATNPFRWPKKCTMPSCSGPGIM